MKVSVSLPDEDVRFLDTYSTDRHLGSRSAAVHMAVRLLRSAQLASAYEEAWTQWQGDGDAQGWEATTADGLGG